MTRVKAEEMTKLLVLAGSSHRLRVNHSGKGHIGADFVYVGDSIRARRPVSTLDERGETV